MASPLNIPLPPGGDRDRGLDLVAVYAVSLAIASILVALRIYVRVTIIRKVWWDEFFIVLGLVRDLPL